MIKRFIFIIKKINEYECKLKEFDLGDNKDFMFHYNLLKCCDSDEVKKSEIYNYLEQEFKALLKNGIAISCNYNFDDFMEKALGTLRNERDNFIIKCLSIGISIISLIISFITSMVK